MESRREFLKQAGTLGVVAACGGLPVLLEGCLPVPYVESIRKGRTLEVSLLSFEDGNRIYVKHPEFKAPILIQKSSEIEYSALLMICTHKGCRPRAAEFSLKCPCHGSRFDLNGKVLRGPAEKHLPSFPVNLNVDQLVISI